MYRRLKCLSEGGEETETTSVLNLAHSMARGAITEIRTGV